MVGKWHNDMEGMFPETMQEVKFFCSSKGNNTCRRADILLGNNRTCEIQHSYIAETEIVNRFNDWNKFGKEIIWLIDGNQGIDFETLSNGNILVIFNELWKYKSFVKTYDNILIENNKKVYKIELKKIKSNMIELKESKSLEETIDFLQKNPDKIWNFWDEDNTIKSKLSIYQQGAGNGKTFNIWKSIAENLDKNTFILLTKQHTAKNVIFEELQDQKKRYSDGESLYHIENIENDIEEHTYRQYVYKYHNNKAKRHCKVIIGTIDSFCYNLANSNSKGSDFFRGIVKNIGNNGANKVKNGYMKYGGQNLQLCKECEIWIDEVQDLEDIYLKAMCKLMFETSCYINIVGDKLQSLEYTNSFLTSINSEGLPNIIVEHVQHINKNRRIKVTNMANTINKLISFEKYGLPPIDCDDNIGKNNNDEPIKLIDSPHIYANDTDDEKISMACNEIMRHYKREVDLNNYLPNDFLIIFPIMKGNVFASELETKIQEFWINKLDDKYTRYVYLHKHTEGTVINTNDSINATRIMSIKASKGDGRKVVFILGVTEQSLKVLSNNEMNLIYESYLHVSLTRAKHQIYFGLIKNNDDICKRFHKTNDFEYFNYLPNISKRVNLQKVNELIDKNELIKLLYANNVSLNNIIEEQTNIKLSKTVDWGYHCIKHNTFYINVILNIINNKNKNLSQKKSQLFVKLNIISKYLIKDFDVKNYYTVLNNYQYKDLTFFPLCKLSNKPEYENYFNIIKKTIIKVQKHIINNKLEELNVYESIILTYMLDVETNHKYSEITPMDIYNITDYFQKNTNKEKELLDNINNIKNIIDTSEIKNFKNVTWNVFKHIELNSENDYFKISKLQFPIIGNNESEIIHIHLKSDISNLNSWDIMIEILLERFLIYNPKSKEDKIKFKNKKINTFLFLLDKNSFIKLKWEWDKKLDNDINKLLKNILNVHYKKNHNDIFRYFEYIKNENIEKWEQEPNNIIEDIHQKFSNMKDCPNYILKFFEDVITKIEDDENYDYIYNIESFNNKINKKLESHIKKYLGL